ncbi:hypothetical protein SLEP1_g8463 [Rubroshorea leprosula]|uniref:Single-stranded DNA-binding protein n=1 Tax=Rubroshorea leprosula TaxID=152421 RepID=A0AAV5I7E7_9ROSI|nr:hypothetical protein SLEP1_g8463 [Rubroshorea leprosula]
MANSMLALSRRLCRSLLSNPRIPRLSVPFSTNLSSGEASDVDDLALDDEIHSESESPHSQSSESTSQSSPEVSTQQARRLENDIPMGVFKAILVGRVGNPPHQKKLRSGQTLTMFSLGTGGQNSRRSLQNEEPALNANRPTVQWHRVCVYSEKLGETVIKHIVPGSILYLEGNLETKVFLDPINGLVQRLREIAIRRNGRLILLGKSSDAGDAAPSGKKWAVFY